MELKGRFNQKMIKRAKFGDSYFDEMGGFDSIERDRVTGAVGPLVSLFSNPVTHRIVPGCGPQSSYLEADTRPTCEAHATFVCTDERGRA